MTTPVSVSVEIKAPVGKVLAMITDLPRMGEWSPENKGGEWTKGATTAAVGTSFKGKNWCDWVYELEPTSEGCRVTHSWIDHRGKVSAKLGKVVSGVADRATHNRKNMEATLQNLAKACA